MNPSLEKGKGPANADTLDQAVQGGEQPRPSPLFPLDSLETPYL